MGDLIKGIQSTPIPTILIVVGLFILVLAFVTKIGGMIEVSPEQRRWAIPIGLLVLTIGLVLYFTPAPGKEIVKPPDSAPTKISTASQERQTFPNPMYADLRLDACYEWANRCGEEPASEWCKTRGFKHAVDYPTENVGNSGIRTKLIGTQAECKESFCAAFKYITCER